ncbi:sorting nexin 2B-like [Iris pallida]|uniref:Sorting nexin 2B-like n=1 Tax=Iris pallida TaxID=29817 RepID=A0AAX6FQR0_IRIPA|nr:sorting nexin 2B-like [Iris pallida]
MIHAESPSAEEDLATVHLSDPPSIYESAMSSVRSPPSPPSDTPSLFRAITVTDPRREIEAANPLPGSTSFVTYSVTSSDHHHQALSVRRRFRDFVTLADRLSASHRGLFVPPRPDKSTVESQTTAQPGEFLERRRAALERYLRRLAEHPVLGRSEELRVFLRAEGRLPMAGPTDVASRMLDGAVRLPRQLMGEERPAAEEAAQPARSGRDMLRIFKEMRQAVVNEIGGARPAAAVEEDREFLERKERVQDFEQRLSTASQQAEMLVKCQHDLEETMGELGLAFIKLLKFENEEATCDSQRVRAVEAKRVATAAVKASRYYRELNAQTVKHLDTLHDYLGLMLAIRAAFSDRSNAQLTVQTLMSDLSSLHGRAEKLEAASSKIFGGDESRIRKLEEIRKTIRVTEEAKVCAVREYEKIKENNRCEFERLDVERPQDFLSMLKGFVQAQVGYAEKIANVWENIAEETRHYATDRTLSV